MPITETCNVLVHSPSNSLQKKLPKIIVNISFLQKKNIQEKILNFSVLLCKSMRTRAKFNVTALFVHNF